MRQLLVPRRRLQELAPTNDGMFRAKLGEDYDGIGQYVLVTLAGSAVGGAYKARVAAGDFGGARTFPRGTPVTIHSYRGQLEVFLGNIPQPCVFLDDFDRVEVNTLGLRNGSEERWGFAVGAGRPPQQVNGSEFVIPFTATERSSYVYFDDIDPLSGVVPELLKKTEAFSFRARFQQSGVVSSGSDLIRFLWYGPGFTEEIRIDIHLEPSAPIHYLSTRDGTGANGTFVPPVLIPNTWYIYHLDVKPGVYARSSLYPEDEGFTDWQIDAVDDGLDISQSPLWDFANELQFNHTFTRVFDYLKFCPPAEP